jgi:ATP-dependent DNA ligase
MDCLPVSELPEGEGWTYEIKLDGYRLEAVKNGGETTLYSRRRNVLNKRFAYIAAALKHLPDGTILDGELVALDDGRPTQLQSFAEFSVCAIPRSLLCLRHPDAQGARSDREASYGAALPPAQIH